MTAAGVATVASTGRLIDRFRDRVMFPIIHNGEILGFVGRRHPDLTDTDRGRTEIPQHRRHSLFHKGAQLFGANEVDIAAGGIPVIVEGPMDAIAVTWPAAAATSVSHHSVPPSPMSRPASSPPSARTRSWPPTPTSPAGSPPNATSGSSPPTASTPDTLLPEAATRPTYWPQRPGSAHYRAGPGGAARRRLIEERLTSLPPEQAQLEAARVVAARPQNVGTRAATPSAPAQPACLRFGRPCSPTSRIGTATREGPLPSRCRASTTSRDG